MRAGASRPTGWAQTRRARALIQWLLFLFTVTTPLLPCAHAQGHRPTHAPASVPSSDETPVVPAASTDVSMPAGHVHHHGVSSATDAPSAPSTSHAPAAPVPHHSTDASTCLWVMGCAGAVSMHDIDAWVPVMTVVPTAHPSGDVLQHVAALRDLEVPPPRR